MLCEAGCPVIVSYFNYIFNAIIEAIYIRAIGARRAHKGFSLGAFYGGPLATGGAHGKPDVMGSNRTV